MLNFLKFSNNELEVQTLAPLTTFILIFFYHFKPFLIFKMTPEKLSLQHSIGEQFGSLIDSNSGTCISMKASYIHCTI